MLFIELNKIEGMGNHNELLKSSEEYRKIFIKKFDLDEQKLLKGEI